MVRLLAAVVLLYSLSQVWLLLRMWLYLRRARSRPASEYTPRAAVIVPCREVYPDLHANVQSLLRQDYPNYRVVFVTGSESDPAWSVLRELAQRHRQASLVAAGPPTGRSQKVHNSLRALEEVGAAEVFVFADSDARYPPQWLDRLIAPLSQPDVGATTGCFWWDAAGRGFWAQALAWGFNTQVVPFFGGDRLSFAWGGSMAIRASTFQEVGIANIWQSAAYDDLPMAAALTRRGLRLPFVPEALVTVPVPDGRLRWCFNWMKREMVAGRVYTPHMYWLGLLLTLPALLTTISPLLLLAVPLGPDLAVPALLLLSLLPVRMVTGALLCLVMGRAETARYGFLDYPAVVMGLAAIYLSIVSNRFTWGDITYELVSSRETRVLTGTKDCC